MDYSGFPIYPLDYCVNGASEDYHGNFSYSYECIEDDDSSSGYLNDSIRYTFYWALDCIGTSAFNDTIDLTDGLSINCDVDVECEVANETVISPKSTGTNTCKHDTDDGNWETVAHAVDFCLCQNVSTSDEVTFYNFTDDLWSDITELWSNGTITDFDFFYFFNDTFYEYTDSWSLTDSPTTSPTNSPSSDIPTKTPTNSPTTAEPTGSYSPTKMPTTYQILNFTAIQSFLPSVEVEDAVYIVIDGNTSLNSSLNGNKSVTASVDLIFMNTSNSSNVSIASSEDFSFALFLQNEYKDETHCLGRVCDEKDGIYWVRYNDVDTTQSMEDWCPLNGTEGADSSEQTVDTGCNKKNKEYTIVECPDLDGADSLCPIALIMAAVIWSVIIT